MYTVNHVFDVELMNSNTALDGTKAVVMHCAGLLTQNTDLNKE